MGLFVNYVTLGHWGCTTSNHSVFMSRVGLVSKCVDQGDVELIGFDKEFLFLLLPASSCRLGYIPFCVYYLFIYHFIFVCNIVNHIKCTV